MEPSDEVSDELEEVLMLDNEELLLSLNRRSREILRLEASFSLSFSSFSNRKYHLNVKIGRNSPRLPYIQSIVQFLS